MDFHANKNANSRSRSVIENLKLFYDHHHIIEMEAQSNILEFLESYVL